MPFRLKKTIAMVGMMGAGKTAIGQALARHINVPFVDSDAELERAANMTIAEIFERDGEGFFRQKESQVIKRLLEGDPCVLSTGGGAFLRETNRNMITERGASVWLRADIDLLWNRVKGKSTRPLLRTADPRATLNALYEDRVPEYSKADIAVTADATYSISAMTERVTNALLEHPDILEMT